MSMNTSFFEKKIKKHLKTYPELLETKWLTHKEQETNIRHLDPANCSVKLSKNSKTLQNDYITAGDILKNVNLCLKCRNYSLHEKGSLGGMLGSQIKILEETDPYLIVEKFWQGSNRTITSKIHKKFWRDKLEKKLKENNTILYNNIYCVTYGSLHYAKLDMDSSYSTILHNITNGYLHKSPKGAVWLYTKENTYINSYNNSYEILLENEALENENIVFESFNNLSEMCDSALIYSGWGNIKEWWSISKKL